MKSLTEILIETAKNGEDNLVVNGFHYYSKYNPSRDVSKNIASKIEGEHKRYVVIGIGLGYHVDELLTQDTKEIIVLEPDTDMYKFAQQNGIFDKYIDNNRVKIYRHFNEVDLNVEDQLIVLPAWKKHLHNENFKLVIEQLEFEFNKGSDFELLYHNFTQNIQSDWQSIRDMKGMLHEKTAILVAAGPDLDNQIEFLKRAQNNAFILCVSAAFKTLYKHGITPNGISAIDQKVEMSIQLPMHEIDIPLFLLSTVHPSFTANNFKKYLLFQQGLDFVEKYALQSSNPLIQSHGSVATASLNLLQFFEPKQIIFVGQDLAMHANKTHSMDSSSAYELLESSKYKTISNSGETVETQLQWQIFKRHIEKMICEHPNINYINTSYKGAKISGAPYLHATKIKI